MQPSEQQANYWKPGFDKLTQKQHELIERASDLLQDLRKDGKTSHVKKLLSAVNYANSVYKDFASIDLNQEFNFSIKAIIANLRRAQDNLERLIEKYEDDDVY